MHKIFLGLGTNLGNREENLNNAIMLISENVGDVLTVSSFYKSEPQGFVSDNYFLNAVLILVSPLNPVNVLKETQKIEKLMGRKTKSRKGYTDRIIDIDILFYDDLILNSPTLKIPHPHIAEREFVLIPLAEIAPEFVQEKLGIILSESSKVEK